MAVRPHTIIFVYISFLQFYHGVMRRTVFVPRLQKPYIMYKRKFGGGKLYSAKNGIVITIIIIRQKLRRRKTNRLRPSPCDNPTMTTTVVAAATAILLLIIKNGPSRDRFVKYSRHNSSRVGVSSITDHSTICIYIYII